MNVKNLFSEYCFPLKKFVMESSICEITIQIFLIEKIYEIFTNMLN